MHNKIQTYFLSALILLVSFSAQGQTFETYGGDRKFDGIHRNEVYGNLVYGYNVVSGHFFGESATYTRHLTDRWSVSGSEQAQFLKRLYSLDVAGTYRVPLRYGNLYCDARILANFYRKWSTNEFIADVSTAWVTSYTDLRVGFSFIHFHKYDVNEDYKLFTDASYTELPNITFGFGVNIRPRSHPWNLGLFFRNYDQYYYETWNINWGIRFHATLPWNETKLFGEFNIRPSGSMSQLATRYETSAKIGLKYVW